MKPKLNMLYFKNVLDRCMARFFAEHDSEFSKDDEGRYVLSKPHSHGSLVKLFTGYVKDEISEILAKKDASNPEAFFILGSCVPGKNALLDFVRDEKLRKLVEILPDVTYFLKERDISVDMRLFNSVFCDVFEKFMKERRKTWKNVFFVRHGRLDCYVAYKILKKHFGSMSVNLKKSLEMGEDRVIFSVNDEFDRKCPPIDDCMRNGFFKTYGNELCQYADSCANGGF